MGATPLARFHTAFSPVSAASRPRDARHPSFRETIIPILDPSEAARAVITGEKTRVRTLALGRRDGLAEDARAAGSAAITDAVLSLDIAPAAVISAFLPIRSEVDLGAAIAGLDARGHPVGLPVMLGDDLLFRRYRPGDAVVPLGFGTRGPGPDAPVLQPDILLMPLAAFDRRGGRVGYGRGFYDRAVAVLQGLGRTPRLIGVAFSVQEVAAVPMEAHDAPLDMIITERETLSFIRGRL